MSNINQTLLIGALCLSACFVAEAKPLPIVDGAAIVNAGVGLKELGVEKVEVLSADALSGSYIVYALDGKALAQVDLWGDMQPDKNGQGMTTRETRVINRMDNGLSTTVVLESWMPDHGVQTEQFPAAVEFHQEDASLRVQYDLFVPGKDLNAATINGIEVTANGEFLFLSADELDTAEGNERYSSFVNQAGAGFALDNPDINILMRLPIDGQVFPFTPMGNYYLTAAGDDHDSGDIPEHTFWGSVAACGTHAACYFGAQIPPPCWVACAICGWSLGEAIWGAF